MPTHPQRGVVLVPSALCTRQSLCVSLWMGEWPSKGDSLQWPGASMSHWLHVLSSSTDLLPKLYKCVPQERWPSACHKCFSTFHCEPVTPLPPPKISPWGPETQSSSTNSDSRTEQCSLFICFILFLLNYYWATINFTFLVSFYKPMAMAFWQWNLPFLNGGKHPIINSLQTKSFNFTLTPLQPVIWSLRWHYSSTS